MDPRDYLTPFYGSVPQSVRELFVGHLGWFDADPVALAPVPPREAARRLAALFGVGKLRDEAAAALGRGDAQWAAELATILVQADPEGAVEARKLKADAFRKLAAEQTNPNWRNWYITAAIELDRVGKKFPAIAGGLTSPAIVSNLPPGAWVNSWTMRLDPTKSAGRKTSAGFLFPKDAEVPGSTDQRYTIALQRAVAEYSVIQPVTGDDALEAKDPARTWAGTTFVLSMTQTALYNLLTAEAEVADPIGHVLSRPDGLPVWDLPTTPHHEGSQPLTDKFQGRLARGQAVGLRKMCLKGTPRMATGWAGHGSR